ncbi:hypothetical protein D3C71_1697390 [compost metagenome]
MVKLAKSALRNDTAEVAIGLRSGKIVCIHGQVFARHGCGAEQGQAHENSGRVKFLFEHKKVLCE